MANFLRAELRHVEEQRLAILAEVRAKLRMAEELNTQAAV